MLFTDGDDRSHAVPNDSTADSNIIAMTRYLIVVTRSKMLRASLLEASVALSRAILNLSFA